MLVEFTFILGTAKHPCLWCHATTADILVVPEKRTSAVLPRTNLTLQQDYDHFDQECQTMLHGGSYERYAQAVQSRSRLDNELRGVKEGVANLEQLVNTR